MSADQEGVLLRLLGDVVRAFKTLMDSLGLQGLPELCDMPGLLPDLQDEESGEVSRLFGLMYRWFKNV